MKQKLFFSFLLLLINRHAYLQSSNLETYWQDGLKFRSKDRLYKFSVGGRVHYDLAFLRHSPGLDTIFNKVYNNVELRRARISFEGSINNAIEYEFEFTFREAIEYADMAVSFLRMPFFDGLKIGYFREPFGLEELTSSNAIVFMERSLTSAFGPGRNTGLMLQKAFAQKKAKVYTGFFRITNDLGADLAGENKHSLVSRIAYNPIRDTSTNKALHLGVAVNSFTPLANTYQIETENEANTSLTYIRTGKIKQVRKVTQMGAEFGYTRNRLYLQSEYIYSLGQLSSQDSSYVKGRNANFHGYYAMASYFFRGKRAYNNKNNVFSSVSLTEELKKGSLKGAWEVGARFSHINITDALVSINRMSDVTLGVSWYFNSNSRIMMNYIITRLANNYSASALQWRVQVTF